MSEDKFRVECINDPQSVTQVASIEAEHNKGYLLLSVAVRTRTESGANYLAGFGVLSAEDKQRLLAFLQQGAG